MKRAAEVLMRNCIYRFLAYENINSQSIQFTSLIVNENEHCSLINDKPEIKKENSLTQTKI